VEILGRQFPAYDLLLIAVGPLVLLGLTLLLTKTRFGTWCAPPRRTAKWWAPWA
jgi:branched-subunit amino acid ABC-type transport system permease component